MKTPNVKHEVAIVLLRKNVRVGAHPTYNADWKKQAKLNLPTGGLDYDEL